MRNKTTATASFKTLSPKTKLYNKGGAETSAKTLSVATGSVDEINVPYNRHSNNGFDPRCFLAITPISTSTNVLSPNTKLEITVPTNANSAMVKKSAKKSRRFRFNPAL